MRHVSLIAVGLLLLGLVGTSKGAEPTTTPTLYLHRGNINTRTMASEQRVTLANPSGPYQIVQFNGPISMKQRAALEQTGVSILEYLPDFAYLVRGTAPQLDAAALVPDVHAVLPFTTADKLAPSILQTLDTGTLATANYRVRGWPGGTAALRRATQSIGDTPVLTLESDDLLQLAADPAVRWIEPVSKPRLLNDVAATILHIDTARASANLFGAGQIIGVADSGLDSGNLDTISPDFAGRVRSVHILANNGDLADTIGHGTHVAGSIAGAGVQSGANPATQNYAGSFAGMAPEAQLVVQAFEADAQGQIVGLDDDYYKLFEQAYADGARLHSDSWGDATGTTAETEFGGYPFGAQRTDQFIWEHPDMAIFFAAGNSGTDGVPGTFGFCSGGNGVIDPDSLLTPGTAKNVITVGASENLRTSGGASQAPWLLLNFCFLQAPLANDTPSNNVNGMAAFSSRGPTDDGRIKPDLVAPGTNIVSNRSHAPNAGTLWGAHETNQHYSYSGGTSMATPLVAGSGALIREWLAKQGNSSPSAAAIKAVLLNSATDMAPGQYGVGATQEIPFARPNSVAGWGRADLAFLGNRAPFGMWIDDHTAGLQTGQAFNYATSGRSLTVTDSTQPLRVMLTWTDPPASLSAAKQLVNDLDLIVRGPDGTVFFPNGGTSVDRINNVEGVMINTPTLGTYSVEVNAFNVPIAEQPYALVVSGPIQNSAPNQPTLSLAASATPENYVEPGSLITYTYTLAADQPITQPITVSATLPVSTTIMQVSDAGTVIDSHGVGWLVPDLAAGTQVRRTVVVRVPDTTPLGTRVRHDRFVATSPGMASASGPPVIHTVSQAGTAPSRFQRVWLPMTQR